MLVFYVPDHRAIDTIVARLSERSHPPVDAENPCWTENGATTIEDPDGWHIVLMPSTGI
jgi:hypothetical protein